MDRAKALQQLLTVNNTPKQHIEQIENDRETRTGMSFTPDWTPRIRDRMNAEANKPIEQPHKITWAESVAQERAKNYAEGARRNAERAAAAARAQAKKEEDVKCLREARDRQKKITEHNLFASELRAVLSDCTAEEVQAVLKLTREWKTSRFLPSYSVALEQVRSTK